MKSFDLAPMDTLMTTITALVLALPLFFVISSASAPPFTLGLGVLGVGLVALYASIWLAARPKRFTIDGATLAIRFPVWTREIPISCVQSVEVYPANRFREDIGWGMRVGAGGLWGGFGLLVCKDQTFEMYVSRVSDLVVVRCEGRRPLLISPVNIEEFAVALRRHLPSASVAKSVEGGISA